MITTIPHWLLKQAELNPGETAIEMDDGATLSYQELHEKSLQYAAYFEKSGVKKGDHVAVLSSNRIEMPIVIHSLSYIGAVIVLLNTRLTAKELAFQLQDAEAALMVTEPEFHSVAGDAAHRAGLSREKIVEFREIHLEEAQPTHMQTEINLGDLFTIMYTSGTTGNPKGVQLTYGNHWASAVSSALNLSLSPSEKWLVCLPVFHVSGFSALIKNVVYGMPILLMKRFEEKAVINNIRQTGVTMLSAVSVMLQRMMSELGEQQLPDYFRGVLLGGGPAPKPLLEKAKDKKIPVFQTYGMTETASQIVTLNPKDALRKLGSAGKPLSTASLKIDAAMGEVGEIKVKGPMVTTGYYKREEATAEVMSDGWLATGDLGYQDNEGFLHVVDRRKDLIISGGENIYPAEIESVLSGMEGIREAGVTGIKDKKWGQVPVAFIVSDTSGAIREEDVLQFCNSELASYKCPKEIHFVDKLPRNASNKLMRRELLYLRKVDGDKG
ncbi:2-succinylbenzoate--CoA ligase [Thalassobacillus devorans]|uniref:2-succinylbenzoate--CoA ligase n=1 Tax=Thalassobacillus devorans TaxID=279813 RepID=A0ABQ1NMY4_9BACI|nr:o-succinylbenzoate--CoA ligase [Thalassobacillus devorans]NIK29099.1 O-succinylbenzoic acid--CoA ligase [Thalassobacillus devorans]GGC81171.1 2-succinylbenzoate--CoA ligase [Thalassobacillus devorans]